MYGARFNTKLGFEWDMKDYIKMAGFKWNPIKKIWIGDEKAKEKLQKTIFKNGEKAKNYIAIFKIL